MRSPLPKNLLSLSLLTGTAALSQGVIVGVETFDTEGLIAGQTGGTGFNYDNLNGATTGTTSDWDDVSNTPSVTGGQLVTNDSSAKREYNGDLEGSGTNDAPNTERAGAARGSGVVFYSVELTRTAGTAWSGISSYDFGGERLFFGVPNSNASNDTLGISETGVGETFGTASLIDGTTHNIIAVIDFDNDLAGLFLDPDGSSDFWNISDGSNSADVTRDYTGTNWSTAARLGSGGEASWDNLTVGLNDPTDVGLLAANPIPEVSTGILSSLAALMLLRRRR